MPKCLIRISMRGTWFLHLRELWNEGCRKGLADYIGRRLRGEEKQLERKKMGWNGAELVRKACREISGDESL